jgi:hypothetical protein
MPPAAVVADIGGLENGLLQKMAQKRPACSWPFLNIWQRLWL